MATLPKPATNYNSGQGMIVRIASFVHELRRGGVLSVKPGDDVGG